MWNNLPSDLLANVFSFLCPYSLAQAKTACRQWNNCANSYPIPTRPDHPSWFLALPTRSRALFCYVQNPVINKWHELPLMFLPDPIRPISSIGSLILFRPTNSTVLQLGMCNPFTREFRYLPRLNISRTNPAVGVVVLGSSNNHVVVGPCPHFRVYVAGGMSEAPRGGARYESTLEMYDSVLNVWKTVGLVPAEFAVRLTVWTPNESVYSSGVLYWMTSARAYSVMGFEIGTNQWCELSVAMADRLEFAALVRSNGKLALVGGECGSGACVWELNEGSNWGLVAKVPIEMGLKFLGGKGSWDGTKCVGGGKGSICLYRELGLGMVVWREIGNKGKWEWAWIEGCIIRGKQVHNFSIKGVLVQPNVSPSSILFSVNK